MESPLRQASIDATIREWQTAGDIRTDMELRPLATAAFDAYIEAFDEAYDSQTRFLITKWVGEGMDPIEAIARACLTAYNSAGQIAKTSAQDALAVRSESC